MGGSLMLNKIFSEYLIRKFREFAIDAARKREICRKRSFPEISLQTRLRAKKALGKPRVHVKSAANPRKLYLKQQRAMHVNPSCDVADRNDVGFQIELQFAQRQLVAELHHSSSFDWAAHFLRYEAKKVKIRRQNRPTNRL